MRKKREKVYKCGVCDKILGHGQYICGEHWQMISQQHGYPISNRKIRELREKLFPKKEKVNE